MIDILKEPYVNDQRAEIDELKKQIQLLKAELNTLKGQEFNLINSLPIMIFAFDQAKKIILTNHYFCQTLAIEPEEAFHLSVNEIFGEQSLPLLEQINIFDNKYPNNTITADLSLIRKNGTELATTVIFAKYVFASNQVGVVGVGFDNSKTDHIQKKSELSRKQLLRFISLIAHDLKNPFNSLVGFSNLLLENYDRYTDEKRKEFIRHLYHASLQGSQLLDNLLEWSRVTSGRIDAQPTYFLLNDLIEQTIYFFESNIIKKELKIKTFFHSNLLVYADENMIRTVLRNLLSNSIKFSYRGGSIEVRVNKSRGFAKITITDHGVGMDTTNITKYFNYKQDVQSSRGTEGEKGTGLGLLICKEFVEMTKGKLKISGKLGKGVVYTFYLPLDTRN